MLVSIFLETGKLVSFECWSGYASTYTHIISVVDSWSSSSSRFRDWSSHSFSSSSSLPESLLSFVSSASSADDSTLFSSGISSASLYTTTMLAQYHTAAILRPPSYLSFPRRLPSWPLCSLVPRHSLQPCLIHFKSDSSVWILQLSFTETDSRSSHLSSSQ